jgi:hypothetical protein
MWRWAITFKLPPFNRRIVLRRICRFRRIRDTSADSSCILNYRRKDGLPQQSLRAARAVTRRSGRRRRRRRIRIFHDGWGDLEMMTDDGIRNMF